MNVLVILLVALAGSVFSAFLTGKASKSLAMISALINLALAIYVFNSLDPTGGLQFTYRSNWIPSIGAFFHIGVDGIAALLVLMTNILMPVVLLRIDSKRTNSNIFYALALLMQAGMLGVFMAQDALLFYLCWELALIPIYIIIFLWGDENRVKTVVKFFIYTLFGSVFMLGSILYIYSKLPSPNFSIDSFYNNGLSQVEQIWVAGGFLLAFVIKIPLIPFHTWQANTYTQAPTSGTMLLSGIMLKMGLFGLLKWYIPVTPLAVTTLNPILIGLALAGVLYGGVLAFNQKNLKTLLAYSSLSHVGLIAAGILVFNYDGLSGGVLQMFNHGIIVVGLFYVADLILDRTGTSYIPELGGIRQNAPALAASFLVLTLASVALPLTNGFVGEFLLLAGIYDYNVWAAVIGGLTIIIGATYMLRMYQKTMLGLDYRFQKVITDLNTEELLVLGCLIVIILFVGLFPNYILDTIKPSIESLTQITQTY